MSSKQEISQLGFKFLKPYKIRRGSLIHCNRFTTIFSFNDNNNKNNIHYPLNIEENTIFLIADFLLANHVNEFYYVIHYDNKIHKIVASDFIKYLKRENFTKLQ